MQTAIGLILMASLLFAGCLARTHPPIPELEQQASLVATATPLLHGADSLLGEIMAIAGGGPGGELVIGARKGSPWPLYRIQGESATPFGRWGGGPGEYVYPSAIAVTPDSVVVLDIGTRRITVTPTIGMTSEYFLPTALPGTPSLGASGDILGLRRRNGTATFSRGRPPNAFREVPLPGRWENFDVPDQLLELDSGTVLIINSLNGCILKVRSAGPSLTEQRCLPSGVTRLLTSRIPSRNLGLSRAPIPMGRYLRFLGFLTPSLIGVVFMADDISRDKPLFALDRELGFVRSLRLNFSGAEAAAPIPRTIVLAGGRSVLLASERLFTLEVHGGPALPE